MNAPSQHQNVCSFGVCCSWKLGTGAKEQKDANAPIEGRSAACSEILTDKGRNACLDAADTEPHDKQGSDKPGQPGAVMQRRRQRCGEQNEHPAQIDTARWSW
jgi:hypothetical protein